LIVGVRWGSGLIMFKCRLLRGVVTWRNIK
jgi:hypothetical protein